MVEGPQSPGQGTELPPSRDLRRLVADSVLTGLCPLIPVPLLDDWARDLLRKRLVARLAAVAGAALADGDATILACGYRPPSLGGCAAGCLRSLLVQPIVFLVNLIFRKLMRKVFFFLTVKDAVDTFSQTFHEAYLLRHALALGLLREPVFATVAPEPATVAPDPAAVAPDPAATAPEPPEPPRRPNAPSPDPIDPRLLEIRSAVEAVVRHTDTRPVTNMARSVFAGSRRLAVATARRMARVLRRRRRSGEAELTTRLEREGEAGLGRLIDELTADLERRGGYLEGLEAALEARLGLTSGPPATAPASPGSSGSRTGRRSPGGQSRSSAEP